MSTGEDLQKMRFLEKDPDKAARAAQARKAFEMLSIRYPQSETYESVTFEENHVVGSERAIPLFKDELILSPGHVDLLFQLGALDSEDLYKISQNTLREGVQRGSTLSFKIKERLLALLDAGQDDQTELRTTKDPDLVYAKLNLNTILRRDALSHSDIQPVFMQMIEQEAGNISLRFLVEIAKKQVSLMKKSPDAEQKIRQLRADTEIAVRRVIMQELSLSKFLSTIRQQRPELAKIYKLDGDTLFIDSIDRYVRRDLGGNRDHLDSDDLTKRVMDHIFGQATAPSP